MKGVTESDKRDRRHLLVENLDQLVSAMKQSGIVNPVGIVVDATDRMGGIFYRSSLVQSGMTQEEAGRKLNEMTTRMAEQNQFPTVTLVVTWPLAEQLLTATSPTAKRNLRAMKAMYRIGMSSNYLIVGIGSGGNTYGVTDLPDLPRPEQAIHDGQHRHKTIHFSE